MCLKMSFSRLVTILTSVHYISFISCSPTKEGFFYFRPNLKHSHQIEGYIPGIANSAMIDELKHHLMALNSFVLESQGKAWRKQAESVTFCGDAGDCDNNNFKITDLSKRSCTEIPAYFQSHTESIDVQNACVRIYSGSNCSGKNLMLSPTTRESNIRNLAVVKTLGQIKSFSSCTIENFKESSNITLRGEVTVDCKRNKASEISTSILT